MSMFPSCNFVSSSFEFLSICALVKPHDTCATAVVFYVSRVPTAGVILDLEREGISQASLTTHQLCNLIIATALPSKKLECLSHSRRLMGLWSSGPPFTLRAYICSRFLMTFLVRSKYIPLSFIHSFPSAAQLPPCAPPIVCTFTTTQTLLLFSNAFKISLLCEIHYR